ncbi:hypothetical protein RIF29_38789 [Crotalaria pallida]|uniref:Uncharacterized protein n=1 Tax=Crotalaria pallida TaxID=3830 RepID=A0AAN9HP34_CROPI
MCLSIPEFSIQCFEGSIYFFAPHFSTVCFASFTCFVCSHSLAQPFFPNKFFYVFLIFYLLDHHPLWQTESYP